LSQIVIVVKNSSDVDRQRRQVVALIGLGFRLCVTIKGWLKVNLLVNLLEGPPPPHVVEGIRRPRVAECREQSFPSAHC
jgi:hypothetical protein